MSNDIKNLKEALKERIDEFEIGNSTINDTIDNCEPYYSLIEVETEEEFNEYIDGYIRNIDDAKQWLEDFSELLDEFRLNI